MSAAEIAGSVAGSVVMVPVAMAWIIAIVMVTIGIGRALSYEWPRVPLANGRRCKKALWDRGGTVERRNDYERADGSMIEAYDVEWDQYDENPPDAQDSCWRCHLRPEPLLKFIIMRALGQR